MNVYSHKHDQRYAHTFDRIVITLQKYKEQHAKSPTIEEIAYLIGDSEEMVLESLEFGRSSLFLH